MDISENWITFRPHKDSQKNPKNSYYIGYIEWLQCNKRWSQKGNYAKPSLPFCLEPKSILNYLKINVFTSRSQKRKTKTKQRKIKAEEKERKEEKEKEQKLIKTQQ